MHIFIAHYYVVGYNVLSFKTAEAAMILLYVVKEKNEKTGRVEEIVSHGINSETGQNVVLPWESPKALGAHYSQEYGYYLP
ncbi:hypothetical protein [Serratia sp. Se-RSBMAAmG]|uniref:hypothetical protein n=1 Tax=Serratia sp. Se-RSBMAAmG TaxID=3043305 RepID=UPI0024AF8413|nr:hypothetical protein [Serratia sp. Se-RSBMAAmG]MDI6977282.1 hypothetical protein [Serratia sp. Se-RSBMAAmG]